MMIFHWSLSDSKSPQVSKSRPIIQDDLCDAVVWRISALRPIKNTFIPLTKSLVAVPRAPIITVTFYYYYYYYYYLLIYIYAYIYIYMSGRERERERGGRERERGRQYGKSS